MDSTKLKLPYIAAAQSQKHVTHNEALLVLDALVQLSVLDKDLAAAPGSPAEGDRYIVGASATGAWAGHASHIAAFQDAAWSFHVPQDGWLAWIEDEAALYVFDGAAWARATSTNPVPLAGVNATADATNRLAVSSPASLFNHEGAGHQIKINKAAAGNTGSVLFQTGFSGRAEFGLAGDDDFHVKVSPDGSAWHEALVISRTNGAVRTKSAQVDVASAATCDIGAAAAQRVRITGTTTITSLGTVPNELRLVLFAGALTLTHHATSLILPGGGNVAACAGDTAVFASDGSGNWRCLAYQRASGPSVHAREKLTATRSYYVNVSTGSDTNDGLAAGTAFATIAKAYSVIADTLDFSGFTVTIQLASGTYAAGLGVLRPWTGGGNLQLFGNLATPGNVIINPGYSASFGVLCQCVLPGALIVQGMRFVCGNTAIYHSGVGVLQYGTVEFGACGASHLQANGPGARIQAIGNYSIVGSAPVHFLSLTNGLIEISSRTVTLTGTPHFATAFAYVTRLAMVLAFTNTYSGAATGRRYRVGVNSVVQTNGGGPTALPGSTFTGDTTSGSATIASVSSTTGLLAGTGITGTGIPAGAIISSVGSGTITISANATATNAGVTLNQTGLIDQPGGLYE